MSDFLWTDAAIARLRELWAEGHSTAEIGRRMGCGKNAVVGKAGRLGLHRASPIRRGAEGAAKPAPVPRAPARTLPVLPPVRVMPVTKPKAPSLGTLLCCWPLGEPRTPGFRFCDARAIAGRSYCPAHHALAYRPLRDLRDAAA